MTRTEGSRSAYSTTLHGVRVCFARLVSAGDPVRSQSLPCDDDYLLTLQRLPQAAQTIWRGGARLEMPPHGGGSVFIMNMRERWQCERPEAYDDLSLRIGFSAFRALARALGFPGIKGLAPVLGQADPVLAALGSAWVSAVESGEGDETPLMQQLARTLFVHVIGAYGVHEAGEGSRRLLSQAQEDAAKAFMRAQAGRNISVAEIAAAAGLSRGYFSKAFSETVGSTPFRWLMSYRIQRAKDMLVDGLPIAQIAAACGFSDQSHLSRVFLRETGVSPAQWRKHAGGEG